MKLLDTNVIMYAQGKDHSYKKSCAAIIKNIGEGAADFNIDTETLQEILYVYSSRGERKRGISTVEKLLILFPNPISIGKPEVTKAKELMAKHPKLTARDAIHTAVVITHKFEGIVSTDKAFDGFKEIKRFDPLDVL